MLCAFPTTTKSHDFARAPLKFAQAWGVLAVAYSLVLRHKTVTLRGLYYRLISLFRNSFLSDTRVLGMTPIETYP